MRYKTKPYEVEAVQYTGDIEELKIFDIPFEQDFPEDITNMKAY